MIVVDSQGTATSQTSCCWQRLPLEQLLQGCMMLKLMRSWRRAFQGVSAQFAARGFCRMGQRKSAGLPLALRKRRGWRFEAKVQKTVTGWLLGIRQNWSRFWTMILAVTMDQLKLCRSAKLPAQIQQAWCYICPSQGPIVSHSSVGFWGSRSDLTDTSRSSEMHSSQEVDSDDADKPISWFWNWSGFIKIRELDDWNWPQKTQCMVNSNTDTYFSNSEEFEPPKDFRRKKLKRQSRCDESFPPCCVKSTVSESAGRRQHGQRKRLAEMKLIHDFVGKTSDRQRPRGSFYSVIAY